MSTMALALLGLASNAHAQSAQFTVQSLTSLAWWQIDPHYGHLWATTCPDDPSWQAGEARGANNRIDKATRKDVTLSAHSDKRVPLYPRGAVTPVCKVAVSGSVTVADVNGWKGVRGVIQVSPDSLITGLNMRDKFSRKSVFNTTQFRKITFTIDSLTNVQPGDTIKAVAIGKFELHGKQVPMKAPVKAWREATGMRVQTQFTFPADDLVEVYGMSKLALGMGVTLGRWRDVHMGVDVMLVSP